MQYTTVNSLRLKMLISELVLLFCCLLLCLSGCGSGTDDASKEGVGEKIVNGSATGDGFPQVIPIYILHSSGGYGACSGTWVGLGTLLTAAHCVMTAEGDQVDDNAVFAVINDGVSHETIISSRVLVHPEYINSGYGHIVSGDYPWLSAGAWDIALVEFDGFEFEGEPAVVSDYHPRAGDTMLIVGYGATDGLKPRFGQGNYGFARVDSVDFYRVYWVFDEARESNTCVGDSGGPAFVDYGTGWRLVAVTSSGMRSDCSWGDLSIDSRVSPALGWLVEEAGGDLVYEVGVRGGDE